MLKSGQRRRKLDVEGAETIAAQALAFLAGEPQRLAQFLTLTGLDVGELRNAAGSRDTLTSVLAHVMGDESLLLTFAAEMHLNPEEIALAMHLLQGPISD